MVIAALIAVTVLVVSAHSIEPSAFNGRWVMDLKNQTSDAPVETIMISDSSFERSSGNSRVKVPFDGHFHPVASDGFVDAVAISRRTPNRVVEYDSLRGKLVYEVVYDTSSDGTRHVRTITNYSRPDGKASTIRVDYVRIGPAASYASARAGRWRSVSISSSIDQLRETLCLSGGVFRRIAPGGIGYEATIDGPAVPMVGDAADATAAVTMPDARTVVTTMYRRGAPTVRMTMRLLSGDKAIRVDALRIDGGAVSSWTLRKLREDSIRP